MTISGFWKELGERGGVSAYRVTFTEYVYRFYEKHTRSPTVGIDIFQWIFEMLGHRTSEVDLGSISNDEIRATIIGIAGRIRYLMEKGVNFVIVFDGSIKLDKGRNKGFHVKAANNVRFEDKYRQDLAKIRKGEYILGIPCVKQLVEMLKAWNIDFIHAPGDAEIELARLNAANVIDAVITNDADALAHGAITILRKFSRIKDDQNGNFEELEPEIADSDLETSDMDFDVKGKKKPKKRGRKKKPKKKQVQNDTTRSNFEYYITVVDQKVLEKFNLNAEKLMFIACIQGDDYSSGVSNLGIKKAWALATEDIGIDPVKRLKSIYVSENTAKYRKGIMPYCYEERCRMLEELSKDITGKIHEHARIFFKSGLKEAVLDNDFIYASHFYPNMAPHIYMNTHYSSNVNEGTGEASTNLIYVPILPQPLLLKNEVKRGNHLSGIVGVSELLEPDGNVMSTQRYQLASSHPLSWFSEPNYERLMMTMRGNADKEKLIDVLGKAYITKALLTQKQLEIDDLHMHIDRYKTMELSGGEEVSLYRMVFDPRKLFMNYIDIPKDRLDDDFKVVDSTIKMWIPKFFFEREGNGMRLLEAYEKIRNTPKTTPKNSPRKKKTPTSQRTTLDLLASSSKSPIKILSKKSTLLEITSAEIVSGAKRESEELRANGSPKKRQKIGNVSLKPSIAETNTILVEPFEEDPEISRIIDSSDYVGSSFVDDDFANFFKASLSENASMRKESATNENENKHTDNSGICHNSESEGTGNKKMERLTLAHSNAFPLRKEMSHSANTVTRGISLMDQQTRIPSVPVGPTLEEIKNSSLKLTYEHSVADDSFSTNGTTELLFADELAKSKQKCKDSQQQEPVEDTSAKATLDQDNNLRENVSNIDSLSDHGTLDLLFNDDQKQENGIIAQRPVSTCNVNDSISDHGTVDLIFAEDDELKKENQESKAVANISVTAVSLDDSISDHGTINLLFDDDKTPTKPKLENNYPTEILENPLGTFDPVDVIVLDSDDESVKSFVTASKSMGSRMDMGVTNITTVLGEYTDEINLAVKANHIPNQQSGPKTEEDHALALREDNCCLPSDFEGDSIMLAENTDDEQMWIVPPPVDQIEKSETITQKAENDINSISLVSTTTSHFPPIIPHQGLGYDSVLQSFPEQMNTSVIDHSLIARQMFAPPILQSSTLPLHFAPLPAPRMDSHWPSSASGNGSDDNSDKNSDRPKTDANREEGCSVM